MTYLTQAISLFAGVKSTNLKTPCYLSYPSLTHIIKGTPTNIACSLMLETQLGTKLTTLLTVSFNYSPYSSAKVVESFTTCQKVGLQLLISRI